MSGMLNAQLAARQSSEELAAAMQDLQVWEKSIKSKEQALQRGDLKLTKSSDVPVRSINQSTNADSDSSPSVVTSSSSQDADLKRFNAMKDEGNAHFKAARYDEALRCYSQCCILDSSDIAARSNRAFAHIKLNKFADAEYDCIEALKLDSKHVKSLFRRATARKHLSKHAAAIADCQAVLKLEPSNKAAKDLLVELEKISGTPSTSSSSTKPSSSTQRTKLVIQETDSSDDEESTNNTKQPTQSAQSPQPSQSTRSTQSAAPVPPRLPRSPVEFETMYREFRNNPARLHALLSVIQPSQFSAFLRTTLDSNMLSKIISVVTGDQLEHKQNVQHSRSNVLILASVSEAERFELLKAFLSDDEKRNVAKALDSIKPHIKSIGLDADDIEAIKQRYS